MNETGILALIFRGIIWFFTRGWPFGAGLATYGFVAGGFGLPENVGIVVGIIVTIGCLLLRFSLRHPEAVKSWKEHFETLLKGVK